MVDFTIDSTEVESSISKESATLLQSGAKELSEKIFSLSQERCPVSTGNLKASGSVVEVSGGYEVVYTADYASEVEARPQSQLRSGQAQFLESSYHDVCQEVK